MNKTLSKEMMKRSNLRNKSKNQKRRRLAKLRKTKKFKRISIKKDKEELLFGLKRRKYYRQSKVQGNHQTNALK